MLDDHRSMVQLQAAEGKYE